MLPKLKKKKQAVSSKKDTSLSESSLDKVIMHTNASSIETIDTAMYRWIDEKKNAFCNTNKGWKKVPVIWSTPERGKQVKGSRELRDPSGQLILPIITVERTDITKDMARKGPYWANIPATDESKNILTIARKILPEKTRDFSNADAKKKHGSINYRTRKNSDKVVYEYTSIPQPIYIDVTYKITIWTEYQQQMNEVVQPFITTGGGINYDTIKENGYKYEIFIGNAFAQEDNVSNMEEDERKYQTSIEIKALGLLIGDGINDETPKVTVTQNAVEVKIPRERVMFDDDSLDPVSRSTSDSFAGCINGSTRVGNVHCGDAGYYKEQCADGQWVTKSTCLAQNCIAADQTKIAHGGIETGTSCTNNDGTSPDDGAQDGTRTRVCNNTAWETWTPCLGESCIAEDGSIISDKESENSSCLVTFDDNGERFRTCNNGVWDNWGNCVAIACRGDDGEIYKENDNEIRDCESSAGTQIRACDADFAWSDWSDCQVSQGADCHNHGTVSELYGYTDAGTGTHSDHIHYYNVDTNGDGTTDTVLGHHHVITTNSVIDYCENADCTVPAASDGETGYQACTPTSGCTTLGGCNGNATESGTCSDGAWTWSGTCTDPDECVIGSVSDPVVCGNNNSGTQTKICGSDGQWGAYGACQNADECVIGDIENQSCGNNDSGTKTRVCDSEGEWGDFGACDGANECIVGTTSTQVCGNNDSGVQTRICDDQGSWGVFGICEGADECIIGATEDQDCGNNDSGTQSRTCDSEGEWEDWGDCTGEDECAMGTTSTQACGNNNSGVQIRYCSDEGGEGTWGPYGDCENEDDCVNDATQDQDCGNNDSGSQTRTCIEGSWSEWETCAGADECVIDAPATQPCGNNNNGTQSRTCQQDGTWPAWGACEELDECVSGASRTGPTTCGLNSEGFYTQTCTNGSWADTTTCTGTHECVEGTTQDGTIACGHNSAGVLIQDCTNGSWVDSATCNDPDECVEGTTQDGTTVCGINDEGVHVQECTSGQWADTGACTGTNECVISTTPIEGETICGVNDEGVYMKLCTNGFWADTTTCTGTDECVISTIPVNGTTACGLNDEGVFMRTCPSGSWVNTTTCTGTDECEINNTPTVGTTVCGLNDEGFLMRTCPNGSWANTTTCTGADECENDTTRTGSTVCGLNNEGYFSQLCTNGAWANTTTCTGTDECVINSEEEESCGINDNGVKKRVCDSNGDWGAFGDCDDDDQCVIGGPPEVIGCGYNNAGSKTRVCDSNGDWGPFGTCIEAHECTNSIIPVNGETICGLNDEGVYMKLCTNGSWVDTTTCTGTDECVINTTPAEGTTVCGLNDEGVFMRTCPSGSWVNTTTCTGTDECEINNTPTVGTTVCGLNDEGVFMRTCPSGSWANTTTCTGTDECENDATRTGTTVCGANNEGFYTQVCTNGSWANTTTCTGADSCTIAAIDTDGPTQHPLTYALMLHFNANSVSAPIDASANALTSVYHGNAGLSSESPAHFSEQSSLYCNTSSDFAQITYPASLELDGAFTIDFWFRLDDVTKYGIIFNDAISGSTTSHYISASWHPYPTWGYFVIMANGPAGNTSGSPVHGSNFSTTVENDTWYHYAITRDENYNWQAYLNGEIGGGNSTLPAEFRNQTINWGGSFYIGGGSGMWTLEGFVDEFRIVKDEVIWTEDFSDKFIYDSSTPSLVTAGPDAPPGCGYNNSGTRTRTCNDDGPNCTGNALLFHFNSDSASAPIDASANGLTAVWNGNAGLSSQSPSHFPEQSSASFQDEGDNVVVTYPASLALDGEFTIDFWFKLNDITKSQTLLYQNVGGSLTSHWIGISFHNHSPGKEYIQVAANGTANSGTSNTAVATTWALHGALSSAGVWHHFVVTRDIGDFWTIYLDGNLAHGYNHSYYDVYREQTINWGGSFKLGDGAFGQLDGNIDELRIIKGPSGEAFTSSFSSEFPENPPGRYCTSGEGGKWSDWENCVNVDDCQDGFQESQACGNNNSGIETRTCANGSWGAWGNCEGAGECINGTEQTQNCGNNNSGTQTRVCTDGSWPDWSTVTCENANECIVGAEETIKCGNNNSGLKKRVCNSSGQWGNYGDCEGENECVIGDTDIESCGNDNSGIRTRTCNSDGDWGDFGDCEEESDCIVGSTQIQVCGSNNNGTQARTCLSNGTWGGWSACAEENEDVCNMEIVGSLAFNQGINDITGFAQDGREFAVVGLTNGILASIVEITDPTDPEEIIRITGSNSTWRDIKYWNRHIYIGTEALEGIKIINMDDPDNPVVAGTISDWGLKSHNIHINDGYLYIIGFSDHSAWTGKQMYIYDLSTPASPVQVGSWSGDTSLSTSSRYIHDIDVYNNKVYASMIYSGKIYIIDVADKTNPTTLVSFDIGAMSHDCAVTEDEQTLLTAQEKSGGHIKIWDISDYNNITLLSEYSPTEEFASPIPSGMVEVPAGDFYYGPASGGINWTSTETLPDFYIDIHEVTAGEYKVCVDAGECSYNGALSDSESFGVYRTYNNNKDNHPINFVNWQEAVDFCTWKGKRLPTEVEWEKAARGTDGRTYPWGNQTATCNYAVMSGCDGDTQPVGSKELGKSPYGAYNMAGNVWEWTDSWHTSNQSSRVLRGGSFFLNENYLWSSNRYNINPTYRSYGHGFRCVQDISGSGSAMHDLPAAHPDAGNNPEASMVHNVYVRSGTDLAIMSYYAYGVRVLDISDPSNPIEVGFYDTSEPGAPGHWGAYAELPSGHIISSDRENGLYVFGSPLTNSALTWGECTDCTPDDEQYQPCGHNENGTKKRTCNSNGQWGGYESCQDPDACENGTTRDCPSPLNGTQTCIIGQWGTCISPPDNSDCSEPATVLFRFDQNQTDGTPLDSGWSALLATYESDTGLSLSSPNHFPIKSSVYFNGSRTSYSGNSVDIDYPANLALDGDYTLDLWFKADDVTGAHAKQNQQYIISQGYGNTAYNYLDLRIIHYPNGPYMHLHLRENSTTYYSLYVASPSTIVLKSNTWYHFAVTRSGEYTRAFLNGVLMSTSNHAGTQGSIFWPNKLRLGRHGYSPASLHYPFKGHIDDFRIIKGTAVWTEDFSADFAAAPPGPHCVLGCTDGETVELSCLSDSSGVQIRTCTNGIWGPPGYCISTSSCEGTSILHLTFNENDNNGNPKDSGDYNLITSYNGDTGLKTTDGSSPDHFPAQSSVYFDGSTLSAEGNPIDIETASFKLDDKFTITFWIKFDDIYGGHLDPAAGFRAQYILYSRTSTDYTHNNDISSPQISLRSSGSRAWFEVWLTKPAHRDDGSRTRYSTRVIYYRPSAVAAQIGEFVNNKWYHMALVRNTSRDLKLFLNGYAMSALSEDKIDNYVIKDMAWETLLIGDNYYVGYNPFKGYIDDFRIAKGVALYTENWHNDFKLSPPSPSCIPICTPGSTSAISCGTNGTQTRTCLSNGAWGPFRECAEGDCTEGAPRIGPNACGLNNEGFKMQHCVNNTWVDDNPEDCTGTHICENNDSQNGTTPCGWNNNGTLEQTCINGIWINNDYIGPGDNDCNDPSGDVCTNTTSQLGNTNCGENGKYMQNCSGGQWYDDTSNCIESGSGTTQTTATGASESGFAGYGVTAYDYYWHLEELSKRDIHSNANIHQYSFSQTGKDVDVYVVDSGINFDHPMLQDVNGSPRAKPIPGLDLFYNGNRDDNSHGTYCSLCIGGAGFSESEPGKFGPGVARECNLWAAKVMSSNSTGTWGDILKGIAAVKNHNTHNHQHWKGNYNPSVLNFSIGSSISARSWVAFRDITGGQGDVGEQIADILKLITVPAAGYTPVSVIASAGNGDWIASCVKYSHPSPSELGKSFFSLPPSDVNNADPGQGIPIVSSAMQQFNNSLDSKLRTPSGVIPNKLRPAPFSNYGRATTCWAAGHNVVVPHWTWAMGNPSNVLDAISGTSFSGPITVGIVALYRGANPTKTPEEVKGWLTNSTSGGTTYGQIDSLMDENDKVLLGSDPLSVTDLSTSQSCCNNDAVMFRFSGNTGIFSSSIDNICNKNDGNVIPVKATGHNYRTIQREEGGVNSGAYPVFTSAKSAFPGGTSVYLEHDGDRILITDSDMSWATDGGANGAFLDFYEDFTIDFWIYFEDIDNHFSLITSSDRSRRSQDRVNAEKTLIDIYKIKDNDDWLVVVGNEDKAGYRYEFDGSFMQNDTWYHVALTRDNDNFRLFFDGEHVVFAPETNSPSTTTLVNTATDSYITMEPPLGSSIVRGSPCGWSIGNRIQKAASNDLQRDSQNWSWCWKTLECQIPTKVYIDEIRFVNGQALWTQNFNKPASYQDCPCASSGLDKCDTYSEPIYNRLITANMPNHDLVAGDKILVHGATLFGYNSTTNEGFHVRDINGIREVYDTTANSIRYVAGRSYLDTKVTNESVLGNSGFTNGAAIDSGSAGWDSVDSVVGGGNAVYISKATGSFVAAGGGDIHQDSFGNASNAFGQNIYMYHAGYEEATQILSGAYSPNLYVFSPYQEYTIVLNYPAGNIATVNVNTSVAYTLSATMTTPYGEQPINITYTSSDLPSWATLNPVTGSVSGTPTSTGTYTFNIVATNGYRNKTIEYNLIVV